MLCFVNGNTSRYNILYRTRVVVETISSVRNQNHITNATVGTYSKKYENRIKVVILNVTQYVIFLHVFTKYSI